MDRDTELVIQARQGERPAFDELVRRHYVMVRRIAYRFAGIAEDADDLAQEAFVTAYERLHQLEQPDRFAGWLAAIVRSEGLMWRRRRLTQPSFLELDADIVPTEPDWESVRRASIRDAVADALSSLTDEQRQVVRLHYLTGCDYRETADLLDIPVDAVRGRLDRARRVLRKELQEMTSSTNGWELDARDLDALRWAGTMASTDPEREEINSVHLNGNGGVVATDCHRLFCYTSSSLGGTPPALIHADFGRMLRGQYPEVRRARLTLTDSEAVLSIPGGDEVRAPLVDGTYPNYERIIPTEATISVTAKDDHWIHALEMLARQREVGPARPQETSNRILMVFSPDEGRISLREGEWPVPDDGIAWEVSASFPAKFTSGEAEMVVAANYGYVEQAIRALGLEPEDDVEFSSAGELRAFVMRPVGDDSVMVATMPMQRFWPTTAGIGSGVWHRFAEDARKAIVRAQEEAGKRGSSQVSTEHLLLGLVHYGDSAAARMLDRMGAGTDRLRTEVERQIPKGDGRWDHQMDLAPDVKRIIELACEEADGNRIGTDHLLIGLIREGESTAARILADLGVDLASAHEAEV